MKSTLFIAIERMLGALGRQRIITVARADKDFAEKTICLPTHKVRLVHNGMNDIWERPTAISLHSIKLVTIARFQKPKDFTTLLKALSELENYNWVIDLIGDGEDMDAVMQIVKDLDLVGRCNFMGRQDNAGKLLSNYNIYLLSSLSEGLPRSIIEAMGAGLPIIASDVGGVKDLVTVGENGFLFEAGNVSDLKYKLEKLLSDVETIEIMGRRSRELYEQNFSFDIMYNKTTDIYAELLSSPPNKDIL
jgi:glycosyltransferase involved in cell wall biosynthesis